MDKSDLLAYAKEYAATQDLYELLAVASDTPKEDIHRAWRKRSLRYHPDKAGANFDPAKWELFERARDVLSDAAARAVYDAQRSAAQARAEQRRAMDAKRRAMVDDLEARERGAGKRPRDDARGPAMTEIERRRLAEAGRRRLEERQRLMREAEERERRRKQDMADEQPKPKQPSTEEPEARSSTSDVPSAADSKMDIDTEPTATNGDGYDEQIADIQQRLREARERKAARREKKAARRAGDKHGAHEAIPAPAVPEELKKVDEKTKEPTSSSTKSFSFSPATSSSKPRAKGDFSSTMARLRAAQAEKEARKKAEEEEAAGVPAATTTATDAVGS
ncbi:DnaJ-domain-containing protein [Hypoxylon sp. FL1284]|nr:DnaJ-domain-containing protein [Hypoxylon sp. FL1284]